MFFFRSSDCSSDFNPRDQGEHGLLYNHIQRALLYLGPAYFGDAGEFLRILRRRTTGIVPETGQSQIVKGLNEGRSLDEFRTSVDLLHAEGSISWNFLKSSKKTNENFDFGEGSWTAEPDPDLEADYRGRTSVDGIEAYASYLPAHYFVQDNCLEPNWGIYISEDGVHFISKLLREALSPLGKPVRPTAYDELAFEILLRHEFEHYKIEAFALHAEVHLHRRVGVSKTEAHPLYVPYLNGVYAQVFPDVKCLEEGLANRTVLDSVAIQSIVKDNFPNHPKDTRWKDVLKQKLFSRQPPCYRNTDLSEGWEDSEGRSSNRRNRLRQGAMNVLCNQIMSGNIEVRGEFAPYFAFFPDIYFLAAESLVPIHLVRSRVAPFINFRYPPMRDMERLLRRLEWDGPHMGKGKHQKWRRNGCRLIVIDWGKDRCLTEISFKNTLTTLGMTPRQFYDYSNTGVIPSEVQERFSGAST